MLDLLVEEVEEEDQEQQVDQAEEDQRGQHHSARRRPREMPVGGAQEPVDDPGLAPDLGREPAELVGDLRPEHREDEDPEQPPRAEEEPAPPAEQAEQD